MKLYDRVYVHDEDNGIEIKVSPNEWDIVLERQNVVVMTLDDVWEIWDEAAHKQVDSETRMKNIEMFNAFMKSKGINI